MPRRHRLSFERTAGPPPPNTIGTHGLIRACPHPSGPSLVCQHRRKQPLTNIGASIRSASASAERQIWRRRVGHYRACVALSSTRVSWKRVVRQIARRAGLDISRYPPARTSSRGDILRHLRDVERPVVLDVGANVGQSVRRYRNLLQGCEIHSFEPSPTTTSAGRSSRGTPTVRRIRTTRSTMWW